MDEQKNNNRTLSFLASMGLAALGAVIFISVSAIAMFSGASSASSLLSIFFLFLAVITGFFIMPIMAYRHTSLVKTVFSVLLLQICFIAALAIIVEPIRMWILFVHFGG